MNISHFLFTRCGTWLHSFLITAVFCVGAWCEVFRSSTLLKLVSCIGYFSSSWHASFCRCFPTRVCARFQNMQFTVVNTLSLRLELWSKGGHYFGMYIRCVSTNMFSPSLWNRIVVFVIQVWTENPVHYILHPPITVSAISSSSTTESWLVLVSVESL